MAASLAIFSAVAFQPQLTLRPAVHAHIRPIVMCAESSEENIKTNIDSLEEKLKAKGVELVTVQDGPTRAATRASIQAEINQMEEELAMAQASLETIAGPPPVRYSAVGRMRQKIEGDAMAGEGTGAGAEGAAKIKAESVLPSGAGLANIGILLAVVSAAVLASGILGGGSS